MNTIQVIDIYQDKGILQMLWSGKVSMRAIRASLAELNRILKAHGASMNLVITVDASTRLPYDLKPRALPAVDGYHLRGWMVVGDDRGLNHAVTHIMNCVVLKTESIAQ